MNPDNALDEILARLQAPGGYALVRTGVANDRRLIGLDSNENYFADAELIRMMAKEAARCDLRTYPREEMIELREMLGAWLKVEPECIVLANGEDQLIDLAAIALLRERFAIAVSPTYSMYELRVGLVGGKFIQVPLQKDFSLDVPRLVCLANQLHAPIIFLCSPNNPTGNQFPESDIEDVLSRAPGLVVVDEAYVEFAERSLVSLIREYPNLAVIRTFSKAFGIAGARLGYMIANSQIGRAFTEKAQLPYPISRFTARLGIECLRNLEVMQNSVSRMEQERSWLTDRLRRLGRLKVFDSETNFVLVCTGGDSYSISARVRALGVSVKNIADIPHFRGCLRITVGTRPMNEKLLGALEQVIRDEEA